jgi:hypothetical protein
VNQPEQEEQQHAAHVDGREAAGLALFEPLELDREADREQEAEHAVELAVEQHVADAHSGLVPPRRPQHGAVRAGMERAAHVRHVHHEDAQQREAANDIEREDAFRGTYGPRSSWRAHVYARLTAKQRAR